jgi:hypothetical protein
MDDLPDIPAFLIIPQEERNASWKGRKLTKQGANFKNQPSKVEEAATRTLRKELEAAEQAKKEARFAALKDLKKRK